MVQLRLKRAIDFAGASAGLTMLSPLLGVAALAIWADIGRPILFAQRRPGRNGRPFTIFKFRTMRDPTPEEKEAWFRTDADRLTKLGRFLRKISIDELPELINVVRGDMSLVGPRPLLMEYLEKYTPEEMRRHEMPPGITGWAQVNGRQTITFSKRLELDVWYVDNWNLLLDLKILARTIGAVFVSNEGVISGQNVDDVDDIGLSADRERTFTKAGQT